MPAICISLKKLSYWDRQSPVPIATVHFAMQSYSSLHQERAYILSALASEESRSEQFTLTLESLRKKLGKAEQSEDGPNLVANLKKAIATLLRKSKRSQKNQKAMVNNLAAVTSRMQMLEQHQWRRAQFEYSQQAQFSSINGIAMGMQDLGLVSPMTSGFACHSQTPISPFLQTFTPQLPSTPFIPPQAAVSFRHPFGSPLYSPFYEQPRGHYPTDQGWQQNVIDYSPWTLPPTSDSVGNRAQAPRPVRSMSLPAVQRSSSQRIASSLVRIREGEDEAISPTSQKSSTDLGRRLSLVGGASAGLRLQRRVNRENT